MNMEKQESLSVEHRSGDVGSKSDKGSKGEQTSTVEGLIQHAYNRLKELDAVSALGILQEALKTNYEHPEVKYSLK